MASPHSFSYVFVKYVLAAGSVHRLRGIEAEAVEAELVDPVRGILAHELAHASGAVAVVVDGLAPLVLVRFREVRARRRLRASTAWHRGGGRRGGTRRSSTRHSRSRTRARLR